MNDQTRCDDPVTVHEPLDQPAGGSVDEATLDEYTSGLNDEQARAVRTLAGPLLVVAGPGSGKTRVLTHRIAALVAGGLAAPREILAVTFTNKAAGEMRERLAGLLGEETVAPMWVCTFHSFCARLLRIEAQAAGLIRAFTILDSSDVRSVLRDIHRELRLPDDASDVRTSASAISRMKNGGNVRPDPTLLLIAERYRERLVRLGALDFDDLLVRTRDLLENDAELLSRYRRRFRHVLVDEYQDTNPVQYRIVELLAAQHRNLCVVGDADQAIYGFRSATPAALQTFHQDWPDASVVVLNENYRSTPSIVDVCSRIIAPNPATFRPEPRTANPDGEPVTLVVLDDDRAEARWVASTIAEHRHQGSSAVLMRTNAQTRNLEDALMQEGVPYTVVGALRFYERAEIKDAVSYLRLVLNPSDALALARVASSPRRGIGPKALETILVDPVDGDLVETIRVRLADRTLTRARNGWQELLDALDAVGVAAAGEGPAGAVKAALDAGLRDHVRVHGGENAADRLDNLDELLNAASEFQVRQPVGSTDADGTLIDPRRQSEMFLEQISLTASGDEEDGTAGRDAVQLLTAHASKGKEFDTVIVVGVEDNLFPHNRRGERGDEREERRLLFVACSRARSRLTLTRARRRFVHGTVNENPPSPFLDDLPAHVRTLDLSSGWGGGVLTGLRGTRPGSRAENWGRPGRPAADAAGPALHASGPRLEPGTTRTGTRVRHATFGDGTVVEVRDDRGEEILTIAFDNSTRRQFKTSLAPLVAL